eukprot:IDg3635t1
MSQQDGSGPADTTGAGSDSAEEPSLPNFLTKASSYSALQSFKEDGVVHQRRR